MQPLLWLMAGPCPLSWPSLPFKEFSLKGKRVFTLPSIFHGSLVLAGSSWNFMLGPDKSSTLCPLTVASPSIQPPSGRHRGLQTSMSLHLASVVSLTPPQCQAFLPPAFLWRALPTSSRPAGDREAWVGGVGKQNQRETLADETRREKAVRDQEGEG